MSISLQQPRTRWVPVTERLPVRRTNPTAYGDMYYYCKTDSGIEKCEFFDYDGDAKTDNPVFDDTSVTHWLSIEGVTLDEFDFYVFDAICTTYPLDIKTAIRTLYEERKIYNAIRHRPAYLHLVYLTNTRFADAFLQSIR